MKIELHTIPIRELVNGYVDNAEEGVRAYGGLLDVRPPFQREFIYKDAQRDAVIDTVQNGFPLNVMYWTVRDDGGDGSRPHHAVARGWPHNRGELPDAVQGL